MNQTVAGSVEAASAASRADDTAMVAIPFGERLLTALAIIVPLLTVISVPVLVWGWGFSWIDLALLAGMYFASIIGVTVGYHRLFVHRSFETSMPVKVVLSVLGSMAVQGPLFRWAATHRRHHQHSDTPDDPHSPHHGGAGIRGMLKGIWHAHIGWFFAPNPPGLANYIKDLTASRTLRTVSGLAPVWVALGLLIPTVLGGLLTRSWAGAGTGLIWGGLVRVFLLHHVTWSINSACHLWGSRPYHSGDDSRNNVLFGILAMGEGWHNTHHAFPTSARHGLQWWQIDVSYMIIRSFSAVGLVWNVKLPSKNAQLKARRVANPSIR